ncbi:MAG: adenylate/guanylate cyclase domain-containing protein [Oscillatoriales cyanobacterium]|uniref:Adenylate/guanylate cyclase domain-containing protein n=1 Tax=Microcoleus anatoxicus PTRS2 TaxID=2705321 RepID=A0ABU8YRV8_9CYAN|nr:MAG: adenylate/guanylate cyclase domain-containing protein [Oscillatoriales cyanobacterium]TAD92727.1 MAG: adenylate/guanylate cyclase domain-containing protein [Oscillatoriales cyanobacterium]TAE03681.1 MAG: adenylate/guanylate cyclase domain-containing protein [Oscillatoriales cyanobacterium]TAF03939.1 MAG: adenylate/guanylate cyclase domain-containing protein [Oscillatoriales cyanobacterium]TAF45169.1 MAG: adenylate/guanylate cyclase domain-containing protein [Oscillatoriales cyanobacteri
MKTNNRAYLEKLLQERNERPEKMAEIDAQINATFRQTHAIMVIDMSGFSRTTVRHGIIHFLAMIHRMHAIVKPVIADYGGTVVKEEADNIFAVFPDVKSAVQAAIDSLKHTGAVNTTLPPEMDIYLCIGIGCGDVLMLEGEDMYGSEFNLASKLGEDLAEQGEILLTDSAFEKFEGKKQDWKRVEFSISGLELVAYKWARA